MCCCYGLEFQQHLHRHLQIHTLIPSRSSLQVLRLLGSLGSCSSQLGTWFLRCLNKQEMRWGRTCWSRRTLMTTESTADRLSVTQQPLREAVEWAQLMSMFGCMMCELGLQVKHTVGHGQLAWSPSFLLWLQFPSTGGSVLESWEGSCWTLVPGRATNQGSTGFQHSSTATPRSWLFLVIFSYVLLLTQMTNLSISYICIILYLYIFNTMNS